MGVRAAHANPLIPRFLSFKQFLQWTHINTIHRTLDICNPGRRFAYTIIDGQNKNQCGSWKTANELIGVHIMGLIEEIVGIITGIIGLVLGLVGVVLAVVFGAI